MAKREIVDGLKARTIREGLIISSPWFAILYPKPDMQGKPEVVLSINPSDGSLNPALDESDKYGMRAKSVYFCIPPSKPIAYFSGRFFSGASERPTPSGSPQIHNFKILVVSAINF